MTRKPTAADRLDAFNADHGAVIGIALATYAANMREAAQDAQAAYDAIKDDPAARARQDQTLITARGLDHAARAFREAADRADRAREAYQALTGIEDD